MLLRVMKAVQKRFSCGITVMLCSLVFAASAQAQQPQETGVHRDWRSFEFTENGQKSCYMISQPTNSEGNYTRRGDIFLFITHRPGINSPNEISLMTGYEYQEDSTVEVTIEGDRYRLFTQGENAFVTDQQSASRMIDSMKAGVTMIVRGTSSRGTLTTDTYSLYGFTSAYNQISSDCGVN